MRREGERGIGPGAGGGHIAGTGPAGGDVLCGAVDDRGVRHVGVDQGVVVIGVCAGGRTGCPVRRGDHQVEAVDGEGCAQRVVDHDVAEKLRVNRVALRESARAYAVGLHIGDVVGRRGGHD